jgi:TonB-dependent starch-binding outer membrane protein SusC
MATRSPRPLWTFIIVIGAVSACSHSAPPPPPAEPKVAQADTKKGNSVVSSTDIERSAGAPIEKILADRVAGVRLGRDAEGNLTVQIRGSSSFSGGQPLYVIDGVAITPGAGGSLVGINPYDIASIEVLKDAASTTMYGSRGANGVIYIKMKKP